jgi:DnaJ-class molecular chaperone
MMGDWRDEEDYGWWDDDPFEPCPLCHGTGLVNPLTPNLPDDYLCLGTESCPRCEGTGDVQ